MPGQDRTGPMGRGPMTGRRAGRCSGSATPGYVNQGGFMGGFGRGRGYRNGFRTAGVPGWARCGYPLRGQPSQAPFDEKELLTHQAEVLEDRLEQVKKRLSDLSQEGG